MAAASEQAGLDDFGDLGFVQRCAWWLQCVASEAHLDAAAFDRLGMVIVGWLINRLRWVDDLKKHPEINDEIVRAPVFVTGMPRTGTTKLQRVLAADPAVQSLPFWQILNYAPVPGHRAGEPDPRIAIGSGYIDLIAQHSADFLTAHPAFVDAPEEESFVIETDFQSQANCTRLRAPSFWQRVNGNPDRESLAYFKQILQYIQWQRGAEGQRPWVLKSPLHIGNLDSLFEVFPDAVVVHTYRDPLVALPSSCRIVEVFRHLLTHDIDLAELGAEQLIWWSQILNRHLEQRDRLNNGRIFDICYDDIHHDVIPAVRDLYANSGRSLDESVAKAMLAWEASNPQHPFGQHRYSLERYGLTAEQLQSAFSAYIKQCGERFGRIGVKTSGA
ncbi:sulfotransferase [Hydrocarboniphaga sp.]|uniref:sulfotransferase family protein n=1 Tax=Hydrocarboniphaga sp. TaxID=2033016 RepID=UPI00262D73F8|nr:sulfotransferase [Hydrocarboniphaga sp.]